MLSVLADSVGPRQPRINGTALYVGYNTDQQNLDPSLQIDPVLGGVHHGDRLINDGRLFFVKVSYLFRF
jgi:hypothetical protein